MNNFFKRVSSTANRLQEAMCLRGKKQVDLVRDTGIDKGSISNYVSGRYEPKQEAIYKLAAALDVSEMWLWGYDTGIERRPEALPSNIIPMPKMRRIPLLGTIACGVPITAEQNYDGDVDIPSNIHADFALRCKGDSMINARIYDGDICYIRRQSTVQSGQIAAVLIDDEATLKRVRLFDDHIVLEPENPTYRPIVFWNEEMSAVTILGLAVAFTSNIF